MVSTHQTSAEERKGYLTGAALEAALFLTVDEVDGAWRKETAVHGSGGGVALGGGVLDHLGCEAYRWALVDVWSREVGLGRVEKSLKSVRIYFAPRDKRGIYLEVHDRGVIFLGGRRMLLNALLNVAGREMRFMRFCIVSSG